MPKSKSEVDDEFSDVPFFSGDDDDLEDFYLNTGGSGSDKNSVRGLPARQRVELRNEQRSLREQLSDWDDYDDEDIDTDL